MTQNLLHEIFARIRPEISSDFDPVEIVTLTLRDGECAEEFGDELRFWCRRRCTERRKQLARGTPGLVTMAFESAIDAAMFRESALDYCRAVIAARSVRR
jgi:hypothetical protein